MIVERYAANETGRDFVVGDLHGCFGQLQRVLDAIEFQPAQDRLFSVGDLVDRGPDSAAALDWLSKPWFHACRGNHEAMLLNSFDDAPAGQWWTEVNGGDWWHRVDEPARLAFRQAFSELPFAIEVDTARGRVGIVHADCPLAQPWPAFMLQLELGDEHARHLAMWSRTRINRRRVEQVTGIERVVCGHTPTQGFQIDVLGNVWFIDTGAYLQGQSPAAHLTVIELEALFATPADAL